MVSSGRAYQLPGPLSDHLRDRLRIRAPKCLASEDHRTGVDVISGPVGALISRVQHFAEGDGVDEIVVRIGGQACPAVEHQLPIDDDVPACEF